MKSHTNGLWYSYILLIILTVLGSCQKVETGDVNPIVETKVSKVSMEEIPDVIRVLNETLTHSQLGDRPQANLLSSDLGAIDLSIIMEVIDTLESKNYTFLIQDDDNDPFTFSNLIIKKRANGSIDYPYLLEYVVDSSRRLDFISSGFAMDGFSGNVSKRYLDSSVSNKKPVSQANLGVRGEITPDGGECDRDFEYDDGVNNPGGSGSITDDGGTGNNNQGGGGGTLICWDVMEPVQVPVNCSTYVSPVTGGNASENYAGCYYDYNEHRYKPINGATNTVYVVRRRCEYIRSSVAADDSMCPLDEPEDYGVLNNGLDEYLNNPPLYASASEQKHFLGLAALELSKYPDTQEASLSIYEVLNEPLSLTELRELVARTSNIYKKLRSSGFSIDRLNTFNQEVLANDLGYVNLFPEIKKRINDGDIPLSTEEWEALWEIFKPMLAELLIEAVPGGGITIAFKDIIEGSQNADAIAITAGVAALIVEFFPPGKVAKTVLRVGKIVRKGFKFVKYGRKYLSIIGKGINTGLKADFDDALIVLSKNGEDVARISNNSISVSKHGIPAKDGSVIFKNAEEVNSTYPQGWEPPYDSDFAVSEFLTSQNEQFVRVYNNGPNSSTDGRWIVKKSDIQGKSPSEIKELLALPETPNMIVDVSIPSNTLIRTGKAGSNKFGPGGGTQFEIPFPNAISSGWFTNARGLY